MIHIAICDDEKDFVTHMTSLLNQYAAETGMELKVTVYYDGMELIEKYDTTIDLIFLDIQMRLVNGLRAAGRIRQMDEKVGIIFLTTLTQYGLEGYKYQATNYIIKPIKYVRLKAEMDQWLKKHQKDDSPAMVITNDTGRYKVFLKSLRYVETFNRNLLLHTEQENMICYKRMKEMEQALQGEGFIRCHTSYIVNLFYVKGVNKLELELITGEIIPISQPRRKEFMERLADYWGGYAVMWLYNLLDIVATITEAVIFYVMTLCFCKTCRFQKVISRIIPPVVYTMAVIVMTFFVDIGAYRLFVLLALLIGLTLLCYEVSFHRALIVMELSYLLIIPFTESVGLSITDFVYYGDIMTQVDGTAIIKWQIYVFIMLLRLLFLMVTYRLLKNFKYDILPKDAAIVSISFLLVFSVSFASTYGYLNLRTSDTSLLDFITSVLCIVFIVQFLYSRNVSYLREQGQRDKMQIAQLQQQFAYYQEKMKDEERVRSIYHDLKNHLLVMESRQNTKETRQMAQTLRSQIADYEDYVHTGNEFLDIILKDKAAKAHEKQIDFSAMADFHGIGFLEPLDISTIFGNAIDNAIEASEDLPEYKRLITVKAERIRNMLLITIENNMSPENHLTEGTTKKDRFVHGFGIPNIKKAVEKYGGQCSVQQEENTYRLNILIPCPSLNDAVSS